MTNSEQMGRLLVAGTLLLTLAACASSADPKAMVVAPQVDAKPFPQALQHAMCVRAVSGGEETNPLWASKVNDTGFKAALSASLDSAGLTAASTCQYSIDANLLGLEQPIAGFSMTVTSHVNYKVYNPANAPLVLETVDAPYTASFSEAVIGVERLKKANEGAIRENIKIFLDKLRDASLGSSNSASAISAKDFGS